MITAWPVRRRPSSPGALRVRTSRVRVRASAGDASLAFAAELHAKPLKVFILAGQSNMEGHAKIETFDYIGDDPATAPLLKQMRGTDGNPTVCENVWISYLTGSGEKSSPKFEKFF